MNLYMVYHSDIGPVEYFACKRDAEMHAADLNADISNGLTGYFVTQSDTGDISAW